MASFGQFQRSGGPLVRLTPQGWVSETGENMSLPPGTGGFQRGGGDIPLSALLQGQEMGGQIPMYNTIPEFDRSQPVDYMGRKGFLQLDRSVIDAEGRRLMEPLQARERRIADEARALEKRKAESEIGLREAQAKAQLAKPTDEWHIDSASGMMINKRSGEIKPIGGQTMPGSVEERMAAGYGNRMAKADELLGKIGPAGFPTETTSLVGSVPFVGDYLQRKTMTPEQGKFRQAQEDWVRAKLRKESGAAIGKDEMEREIATYFPLPGEPPEVVAQKALARQTANESMRAVAGKAGGMIQQPAKRSVEVGTVKNGYIYLGGDPGQESSWMKTR